jgi:copper homeostasis protein (lipoprotein)
MKRLSPWTCVLLSACALGALACDTRHRPVPAPSTAASSESAAAAKASGGAIAPVPKNLPVIDTYSGLLPCADCAGIRMQLLLLGKRGITAYRLHEVYVGTSDGDKSVDSEGKAATVSGYEGNPSATVYALNPGEPELTRYFLRVDDTHLRMLNRSKQEIVSRLNYTLTREAPPPEIPVKQASDAHPS